MKNIQELDARLSACASFVRQGSVAADIGTDHAYLPIYLVGCGICPRAVASDINEGPIERAKLNIRVSGLADKIDAVCADGLDRAIKYSPNDIIIAGMGGELIVHIISASEYVKNENIRLILQPMTMPEVVSAYLCENGFNIIDEKVCTATGKCYRIICAEYDGVKRRVNETELIIGSPTAVKIMRGLAGNDEKLYIEHIKRGAQVRLFGMKRSNAPDSAAITREERLVEYCSELLKYFPEV